MTKTVKKAINSALSKAGYIVIRSGNVPHQTEAIPAKPKDPKQVIRQQVRNFDKKYHQYAATHKTRKLHFGCGPRVLKGWVNIDLKFAPYENYLQYYTDTHYPKSIRGSRSDFYKFDPTKAPLPIPDNSVDVIFHEDFFEHISQRDQVAFLAETLRVLKKGGVHRVNTPDLIASMRAFSNFKNGFAGTYFGEWDKHQHINVISKQILEEMALMVGYSKVVFNGKNKSTSPLVPKEYRPDPKSKNRIKNGNVFADLIK